MSDLNMPDMNIVVGVKKTHTCIENIKSQLLFSYYWDSKDSKLINNDERRCENEILELRCNNHESFTQIERLKCTDCRDVYVCYRDIQKCSSKTRVMCVFLTEWNIKPIYECPHFISELKVNRETYTKAEQDATIPQTSAVLYATAHCTICDVPDVPIKNRCIKQVFADMEQQVWDGWQFDSK